MHANLSLVLNTSNDENQRQGITKRGGSTMKWISQEQNEAKMEGRKRYELRAHTDQKDRVMQHLQNQQHRSSHPQHVINVNGVNFQVSQGGSKLLRRAGTFLRDSYA